MILNFKNLVEAYHHKIQKVVTMHKAASYLKIH